MLEAGHRAHTHPCGAGGRAGFMGFMGFIGDRAAYRPDMPKLLWELLLRLLDRRERTRA